MINLKKSCSDRTLGLNSNRDNSFSYHARVVEKYKVQSNWRAFIKSFCSLKCSSTILPLDPQSRRIFQQDRRCKSTLESILSWFPLTGSQGLIFCSVTELANRQINRQSTYESIYSIQTAGQKKPWVPQWDKNSRGACVTLFANNPGHNRNCVLTVLSTLGIVFFNSTLNTGDCVLTFVSSASELEFPHSRFVIKWLALTTPADQHTATDLI